MTHDTMTEQDRHTEVDRQIRNGGAVFCPWCGGLNRADEIPCCVPFKAAVDKRGRDLFDQFLNNYRAYEIGATGEIECPYCRHTNVVPAEPRHPSEWPRPMVSPFCCDLFQMAAVAIVEGKRMRELVDHAEMVAERADKVSVN